MNKREKRIVRLSALGSLSMVVLLVLSAVYVTPQVKGASRLQLPYSIAGTDLVLVRLTGYEGPYLEDNSLEEVVDVAAAVLFNAGEEDLGGVRLCLTFAGGSYGFRGYDIPAGGFVTLLETERKTYERQILTDCYATSWPVGRENRLGAVLCREVSMDTVELINYSNTTQKGLELCYKTYYSERNLLMGGYTHRLRVGDIPPGGAVQVYLPNYMSGYSKIIRLE